MLEEVALDQLAGDDDALRHAEAVQPPGELGEPLVVGLQRLCGLSTHGQLQERS